jgi:DNA helicase II / ATP-dependent DNA helicase PcrA
MSTYTEEQLNFINYKGTNSLILSATAGSGKTHSTVGRLNKMIEDGVDPSRIIFFSFTNDAVNELRTRIKHDVKITTIHSFTSSILGKMGLFKPIVTFYDFTNWYKEKYKPHPKDPLKIKMEYAKNVDRFYEEGAYISSTFSAYKLQIADNIKLLKPQFYDEYSAFIRETKSRDFSDMLIDTEKLSKNPKYKHYFDNLYDYVFVDEYQDTSTLQMRILLTMKAKQYHLIGDKNQCIVSGQDILTDNGNKKIQDLKVGDLVLTALGGERTGYKRVTNIKEHDISIDTNVVTLKTKSGKTIKTTTNHTHFAQFTFDNDNKYLVYLMYKKGYGYRIGKTEIYPKRNLKNNSDRFGFKFRLNQEQGDKIWILDSFDTLREAYLNEQTYSLGYGIPTTCFVARPGQDQTYIDSVFNSIDTISKGVKLLKDLHYSPLQPHFVPKSKKGGLTNITINLCSDGRGNKPIHTLEVNGYNEKIRDFFTSNGYTSTDNGKGSGWRIRKQSKNINDIMKSVSLISDNINLVLKAKFIDRSFLQLPASEVVPGMSVMVIDSNGEIILDEVVERHITPCEHNTIYDVDVEDTHNLVVNGIITHNSIYGFSGANCEEIENLLMKEKKITQMTLTKNFRSKKRIVENSNKYSDLIAVPFHEDGGYIHDHLINDVMMYQMMKDGKPLTVLARTNSVIKEIEKQCLKKKIPMRYFNYITPQDIEKINEGNINLSLRKKIDAVSPYYGNTFGLIKFIQDHQNSDVFVTSIHKSKGREFPRCIVINSIDPDLLVDGGYDFNDYSFITDNGDIDMEARNIHYVAVTRPKDELYFLVFEN